MSTNQFNAAFEALRVRYEASFPDKRQALEQAWDAFSTNAGTATRRTLEVHLHRLCGSAGAYGYERLGERARVAERMLRALVGSSSATAAALAKLHEAVRAVLDDLVPEGTTMEANGQRLRIGLVEDDPAQAGITAAWLTAHGCEVRVVGDADTLWQTMLTWPCHAVVLDYWLHGETAVDIAPRLRREPEFATTALVCFSVERDAAIVDGMLAAGCDAVVGKDEGVERLLDRVCEAVARPNRSGIDFSRTGALSQRTVT